MTTDNLSFLESTPTKQSVSVISIPLDVGKDTTGTDGGAKYLRENGLLSMLKNIGVSFNDQGIIACPERSEVPMGDPRAKYVEAIADVAEKTAAMVEADIKAGNKVVALGGDHSVSIGTISGASKACGGDVGLIYIDAHPDAMTNENTLSGNVHGMVTTALLGFGHPLLTNIGGTGQKIKKENILYIGLKDLDQGEVDFIREQKLAAVSPLEIEMYGLQVAIEKIKTLASRVKNVWVSFDLDAMDSRFAPATPMSSSGGLTYREIYTLSKYIGTTCSVVGLDIVECLPAADVDEKTASMAATVTAHLLGAEYSWYTGYMAEEMEKQSARIAL